MIYQTPAIDTDDMDEDDGMDDMDDSPQLTAGNTPFLRYIVSKDIWKKPKYLIPAILAVCLTLVGLGFSKKERQDPAE